VSITDELLANNARYTQTFNGLLPLPPAKHVAVVVCMDARLDIYRILGLHEGEVHVIRNVGGVVIDDEIRSLAISQRRLASFTRSEIIITVASDRATLCLVACSNASEREDVFRYHPSGVRVMLAQPHPDWASQHRTLYRHAEKAKA
jgi:Carbonic anhydrase